MSAGYNPARLVLSSGCPLRALLVRLAFLAAAAASLTCVSAIEPLAGDPPSPDPAAEAGHCFADDDCVPAGATCCGCPTFAVPRNDPMARACSNVQGPGCPPSECTENVVARCSEELRCELACAPRVCEQSCADGFAADASGCLTCECAAVPPGGCQSDTDCTRTRADCCGCQRGGKDTAVLASERASHDAMLMCPPDPACPGISTCTSDVPTCVQGRCALVSPDLPVGACGRADLPACPAGSVCLVNVSDQANMHGVGVCGPPP